MELLKDYFPKSLVFSSEIYSHISYRLYNRVPTQFQK